MKILDFKYRKSLIFEVSLAVVLVQVTVTAVMGVFYLDRFVSQIDKRVIAQMKAPAELINGGTLGFEAVAQRATIEQIIGGEVIEAIVTGPDDVIYYSMEPSDVGLGISKVERLDQELLVGSFGKTVFGNDSENDYVSISPIYSASGRAPFLSVYIKASGSEAQKEKLMLLLIFIVGFTLASVLISWVIIYVFRVVVVQALSRLTHASEMISKGNFDKSLLDSIPDTDDEIGDLTRAFRKMIAEIEVSRAELEGYNMKLEADVKARTAELDVKVGELEKINKFMVGRELKMIELKNAMAELEEKLSREQK